MRLSPQKARQLSRLVWRDRLRTVLPIALGVLLLAVAATVFFVWQTDHADRTVEVKVHDATVVGIGKGGAGRAATIVHVHLGDGRDVDAFSTMRVPPAAGTHVTINEARHASGRSTFDITGLPH